jgi:1-aminocyclopropane-1-carboxylate deaminase
MIYYPTPVQEITGCVAAEKAGVRLLVKREDLNHPYISGNKWWKLKYNLAEALARGETTVLTFGGAWSNHIYATAAAASELKLKSIGIIRGEETLPLNPILRFASDQGMQIHYVSRGLYREKTSDQLILALHQQFGQFYLIPEGGSNLLAVKGCAEFSKTELSKIPFDHLFVPVGTGGTMAGLVCGFEGTKTVSGISVLKDGRFLAQNVETLVRQYAGKKLDRWSVLTAYHHGGYAKTTPALLSFIEEMNISHDLPLDPVYTGKLVWGALREIESGAFARGDTVLVVHTGGLQSMAKAPVKKP